MFSFLDELLKSVDISRCLANAFEPDLEIVQCSSDRNSEIMLTFGANRAERAPVHRCNLITPQQKHLHEGRWTAPLPIAHRHFPVRVERGEFFTHTGDVREQVKCSARFAAADTGNRVESGNH